MPDPVPEDFDELSGEAVDAVDRQIHSMLQAAAHRRGHAMEAVAPMSSLSELFGEIQSEDEEIRLAQIEAINRFIFLLVQDGLHASMVCANFYAALEFMQPEIVDFLGVREVGMLTGHSGASHSWRVKHIMGERLWKLAGKKFQTRRQRSELACANYAKSARGNSNRRKAKPVKRKAA